MSNDHVNENICYTKYLPFIFLFGIVFLLGLGAGISNRDITARANVYSNFYYSDEKLEFNCLGYKVTYDYKGIANERVSREGKFDFLSGSTVSPHDSYLFSGNNNVEHIADMEKMVNAFVGGSTAGFTWMHLNRNNLSRANAYLSSFKRKSPSKKIADVIYWAGLVVTGYPLGYWLGSEYMNSCDGKNAQKILIDDKHIGGLAVAHAKFRLFEAAIIHAKLLSKNSDQLNIDTKAFTPSEAINNSKCPNALLQKLQKTTNLSSFTPSYAQNLLVTDVIDSYAYDGLCNITNNSIKTTNNNYAVDLHRNISYCKEFPEIYMSYYCKAFSIAQPYRLSIARSEINKCALFSEYFLNKGFSSVEKRSHFGNLVFPDITDSFMTEEEKYKHKLDRRTLPLKEVKDNYFQDHYSKCSSQKEALRRLKQHYEGIPDVQQKIDNLMDNLWNGIPKGMSSTEISERKLRDDFSVFKLLHIPTPLLL